MKTVKRALALLLALTMLLAMSVSALAANGTNNDNGTITINNAVVGQTYTIYQILALESYNTEANAYSYKATTAWETFVESDGIKDVYLVTDDQGYVTWKGETTDSRVSTFAQLAQAYAANSANSVTATKTEKATSTTITFTGLNLGYYLLDSSMGTLCSLNTTNPDATIQEKNEAPTNEKKVEEDSTPGTYGSTNDADIGQTVNFQSTITAQAGAQNYIFHDTMSTGLTFGSVTGITLNGTAVDTSNYTVKTDKLTDGCTFEVVFTQAFCDTLKANDTIVISYTATVNENAFVGTPGNANESKLEYGETGKTTTTPPSKTTTYTWEIDVYKYTVVKAAEEGQADTEKALAGAEFILYKDVANDDATTTRYYAVATAVTGGYRFTGWTTEQGSATKFVTPATGKFAIKGLDSDTYYLEETTAPAGYNVLKDPVKVVIGADGSVTYGDDSTAANPDVKILNNTGAELPSTGGVGTTIFYVLGGLLVVCAGVLLITKRRMNKEA